jgi:hypothetical protein
MACPRNRGANPIRTQCAVAHPRQVARSVLQRVSVHVVCLVWCTASCSPPTLNAPVPQGFVWAGGEGSLGHILLHLLAAQRHMSAASPLHRVAERETGR